MKERPITVAITAVSAQLGGAIARNLIKSAGGEPIVGLARTPANAQDLGIETRPGDYGQPERLRTSLAGVDTFFLVSSMDAPDARVQQRRDVIEAPKAAGVQEIVYTSIQDAETGTAFSPVVHSNRQTEADLRASSLAYAIGRNGIYIEPDVDYIDSYKTRGEIANSADAGKCGYTTRPELAHAYACHLTKDTFNGQTFNLWGTPINQTELTDYLNDIFGTFQYDCIA